MRIGRKVEPTVFAEEFTQQEEIKPKGMFGGFKKQKKQVVASSIESETIWREVNLFIPETIAIVIAMMAVVFGVLLNGFNTIFLATAGIPLLILIGFYMYRLMVFTPTGTRHMVMRIMSTGAIRLSVERIKDMEIQFSKGPLGDKIKVVNPKKHWLQNIGKPLIVLFEGDDSNADLNVYAGNVSQKATDTNTVNDTQFELGRRFERKMAEIKGQFLTPTNIMLIIMLIMIALGLFFSLKNPETTAALIGGM